MEKDQNCAYCMEGELVAKFAIKICELDTAILYLFKEQSHEGRVVVAHKTHIGDMTELSSADRNDFFEEIANVSKALQSAFHPDKINYGAYGDTGHHLHFHLVPKYKDGAEWGGVFAMNPDQTYLTEEQYQEIISKIKKYL